MQLSYNKLRTFGECALKYRFAYVERLPRPPIRALASQRRLHAALATFHRTVRRDGEVREEELLATWARLWEADANPAIAATKEYQEGEEVLRLYARTEDSRAERDGERVPAYLEHPLKAEFGPHILTGTVDRLDFAEEGGYSLVDYKLDRRLPEGNAADGSKQLDFYDLLVYEALGVAPSDVRLYYLRHGVEQVSWRSREQRRRTVEWVDETAAAIRGVRRWEPCEGEGCKTCPFWKTCPAKTGQARAHVAVWRQGSLLELMS